MSKDNFSVQVIGESFLWNQLQKNMPVSHGFNLSYIPWQEMTNSTIPDAVNLVLFATTPSLIPDIISFYHNQAVSVPAAVLADRLPAASVVRLVRSGFTEVFDPASDMELLREWILTHYEDFLITHAHHGKKQVEIRNHDEIHGISHGIKQIRELVDHAAQFSDMTVLVHGETGTGKERVARMIHALSPRSSGPFIEVNCSAIPETLMEAEMLGNEKGAFTDARRVRKGFFELASGGTLFLDEIGVMSPAMQNKMLKVVEEKSFRRIGGETEIRVDIKIIAGTNIDLSKAVSQGEFRPDLLYRLKVFTINIPPLRDRSEDLPILVEQFISEVKSHYKLNISGIHPTTLKLLKSYRWPGNVRELKHVLERACVLARRGRILPSHLPEEIQSLEIPSLELDSQSQHGDKLIIPLPEQGIALNDIERLVAREVLKRCNGNQSETARYLNISRTRLARKLLENKD